MAHYAMIENNVVTNVCEWDGKTAFDPGEGIALTPISELPEGVWTDWARAPDGTWSPPPPVDIADL